jgi:hypothetical protein
LLILIAIVVAAYSPAVATAAISAGWDMGGLGLSAVQWTIGLLILGVALRYAVPGRYLAAFPDRDARRCARNNPHGHGDHLRHRTVRRAAGHGIRVLVAPSAFDDHRGAHAARRQRPRDACLSTRPRSSARCAVWLRALADLDGACSAKRRRRRTS